jgi:hypothetical protein
MSRGLLKCYADLYKHDSSSSVGATTLGGIWPATSMIEEANIQLEELVGEHSVCVTGQILATRRGQNLTTLLCLLV